MSPTNTIEYANLYLWPLDLARVDVQVVNQGLKGLVPAQALDLRPRLILELLHDIDRVVVGLRHVRQAVDRLYLERRCGRSLLQDVCERARFRGQHAVVQRRRSRT